MDLPDDVPPLIREAAECHWREFVEAMGDALVLVSKEDAFGSGFAAGALFGAKNRAAVVAAMKESRR